LIKIKEDMKMGEKKELQFAVSFEAEKLDAMNYFMGEKGVTMESVMQDHLNELYEKYVPSAMRRYLGKNDGQEQRQGSIPAARQAAADSQENNPVRKREERRQAKEQKQDGGAPLAEGQGEVPAAENSQGMAMGM
jgi:hypothetical protein